MEGKLQLIKVQKAWLILRGRELHPPLNRDELKKMYRRKAKTLHPDITGGDSRPFTLLSKAFEFLDQIMVQNPETLKNIVLESVFYPPWEPGIPRIQREKTFKKAPVKPNSPPGRLPSVALRFGQFLYYRGRVSWETLIQSLVWQSQQRPQFGKLALEYNFLTSGDILKILATRFPGEKFGEAAQRLGLLDAYGKMAILGFQRRFYAPVGQYYILKKLLSPELLEAELQAHRSHNLKYRRMD